MGGFREIKNREIKEIQKEKEEEGYKKIKPETDITVEQARAYWNDFFTRLNENKD